MNVFMIEKILFVLSLFYFTEISAATVSKDYCVIGAGPAGLQTGYFLKKANRDFLIFEKTDTVGSFFIRYPRHRKLISINKRHTGRLSKEFNLRHDWNSLISNDDSLLFTKYSEDYFPHADELLRYLHDYQKKLGIPVQFNTEISDLKYNKDNKEKYSKCRFTMKDQKNNNYCCRTVIVATGTSNPVIADMKGSQYLEGYETVSVNPKDYIGKSVLIIGRGNSGLELASSIYGYANYVHLVARDRIKFSWETHYVGDIRAVNNEVLDSYQLKSLDGVFEAGVEEMYVVKREDGKLMLRSRSYAELNTMDHNPVREGYDRIIQCLGFKWDRNGINTHFSSTIPRGSLLFPESEGGMGVGKFPDISYDYQSTQFPGIYFAGPLAHSLDYRKSAGGFLHGFRYTIRAMHHILEWANHGVKWPSETKPWDQLLPTLMRRANEASGIYQMFQNLGDIVILDRSDHTFTYLEEFPIYLIPELVEKSGHKFDPSRQSLLVFALGYGANFSRAGNDNFRESRAHGSVDDAHESNFLHPIFWYYRNLPTVGDIKGRDRMQETLPKPEGIHHTLEDFTTTFDGPTTHMLPLRRFLEFFLQEDLRVFLAETCVQFALTTNLEMSHKVPLACQRYLNAEESVLGWM